MLLKSLSKNGELVQLQVKLALSFKNAFTSRFIINKFIIKVKNFGSYWIYQSTDHSRSIKI